VRQAAGDLAGEVQRLLCDGLLLVSRCLRSSSR
jgi:hypothetical protein